MKTDRVPGLRVGRDCFQTPRSSGIPPDASRRQSRVGGAISAWGPCPHGWPPAVHQRQAGFSCQNPLSKYREAAQPVGGFPGTQTGKPVCVIRGVG